MTTLVTIGTAKDPFPRLLQEVDRLAAAGRFPGPVIVQHGYTRFASSHCQAHAFLERDEFETALAEAGLVITHGGLTVLHAVRAGKVPVVMPRLVRYREHVDDHQVAFAESIARQSDIAIAAEPADLFPAIQRALAIQNTNQDGRPERPEPPLISQLRALLQSLHRQQQRQRA